MHSEKTGTPSAPHPKSRGRLDWRHFRISNFLVLASLLLFPVALDLINKDLRDNVAIFVFLLTLPVWLAIGELWEELEPFQLGLFWTWVGLSLCLVGGYLRWPSRRLSIGILANLGLAILFAWSGLYGQLNTELESKTLVLLLASISVAFAHAGCLAIPLSHPDVTTASASTMCPTCGQSSHASNGLCLTCGSVVRAL